jgi:hypothetical protein
MVFREFIKHTFFVEGTFHISFILCWSMSIQNNDISAVTSQYYMRHPVTNKLYSPNC